MNKCILALGLILFGGLQGMQEVPLNITIKTIKGKVYWESIEGTFLRAYNEQGNCIGSVWYAEDKKEKLYCTGLYVDPGYQKYQIGKLLAVSVVAHALEVSPNSNQMRWIASSSGYMTNNELYDFYEKLGGKRLGSSNSFVLDLDALRKQTTFIDFKKIVHGIEFAPFVLSFCCDSDGNGMLRSCI